MRKFLKRAGVGLLFVGGTFIAGMAGGIMGAVHVLSELTFDCDECDGCCDCDCESDIDVCGECDDTSCEHHPRHGVTAEAEKRQDWVRRMSERSAARVSGVGETPIDPEVSPVGAGQPYDWDACLGFENVDDIPGADMNDPAYF